MKIGYVDDIDKRLKQLNRSECIPFAFRVYATYEVNSRLSDLKLHRLSIIGVEGLFKGLRFTPIFNSNSPERFSLEIEPCIGFRKNDEDYEFYSIENIPQATEEVLSELKKYESPIIQFGYIHEQGDFALREKGYINDNSTYIEKEISKEYDEHDFLTSIFVQIYFVIKYI